MMETCRHVAPHSASMDVPGQLNYVMSLATKPKGNMQRPWLGHPSAPKNH